MYELKLLRADSSWRETRLKEREAIVKTMVKNLKRVWGNFTESVIQFHPKAPTLEDSMGYSEENPSVGVMGAAERTGKLVKELMSKREAANEVLQTLGNTWWSENEPGPVVTMAEAEALVQGSMAKFLSGSSAMKSGMTVFMNKGKRGLFCIVRRLSNRR